MSTLVKADFWQPLSWGMSRLRNGKGTGANWGAACLGTGCAHCLSGQGGQRTFPIHPVAPRASSWKGWLIFLQGPRPFAGLGLKCSLLLPFTATMYGWELWSEVLATSLGWADHSNSFKPFDFASLLLAQQVPEVILLLHQIQVVSFVLLSLPNAIWTFQKLMRQKENWTFGSICLQFSDGWNDSFPGEVFDVLQHTSAGKGWEYFPGTGLETAFPISVISGSIIDSIRIANLALNLSLSRKVSAMVHDSIRQRLALLTKPSAETSCRRPKRSKSRTLNWSLYDGVTLTQLPVARRGGSWQLWGWLCVAVAHRPCGGASGGIWWGNFLCDPSLCCSLPWRSSSDFSHKMLLSLH